MPEETETQTGTVATAVPNVENEEFAVWPLNAKGAVLATGVQKAFDKLVNTLYPVVTHGREWFIAKAKLEEASMYVKKALAKDPTNQGKWQTETDVAATNS